MDILAIGGITIDHIFRVDRLPECHFEGVIESMGIYFGGRAPNVAAMAAVLGMRTGIVSPVGDDFAVSGYRAHLEQLGVDLRGVTTVPDQSTKQVFLFTDVRGNQITFFHYGAEAQFCKMAVPEDLILQSRLVHISSSGDYRFNMKCAHYAHESGIPISFDVGNDPFTEIPEYLDCLIRCSRYLFMNDVEVEGVLARLNMDTVTDLLQIGPETVTVINKRDKSSEIYSGHGNYALPPVLSAFEDPTGASDGYVAGFVSAVLTGYGYLAAARFGTCEASYVMEAPGCQTNLPHWHDLMSRCSLLFAGAQ